MRPWSWLALTLACMAGSAGEAAPSSPVRYTITPQQTAGTFTGLKLRLDLTTRPGEVISLAVPEAVKGRMPAEGFMLEGGQRTGAAEPGLLTIRAAGRRVSVTYRLSADAQQGLRADDQRLAIHATWFALRGDEALLTPTGRSGDLATVTVADSIAGWTVASSITGAVPVGLVGDSQVLGGSGYKIAARRVGAVTIRLAYPQGLAARAGDILDDASAVVAAETAFWRTPPQPTFIGLAELKDTGEISGRGMQGGFSLYLGKDADRKAVQRLIAHENLHRWISRAIGGFPPVDDDLEAWLHEGFTEAYTARILRAAGLWTQADYIEDWNQSLARYGASPVKTAPNSRILADRNRDFDVNRLPYDRGRLLAVLWDVTLRQRTNGRLGLDEVLRAQIAQARRNESDHRPISADRLLPIVARRLTGWDMTEVLRRQVDEGEALTLPPDAFGPCIRVASHSQPVFDRGFDLEATLRAGSRVTGLTPGGPAERAGLRPGDRIVVDEVPSTDSRVALSYRVIEADGRRRVVSYRPEGRETVTFQQLALAQPTPSYCPTDRF